MIERIMTEQKTKEELSDNLQQIQDKFKEQQTMLLEAERIKQSALKRNGILEHELELLKRAKAQLSDHNEQIAKEITSLQSIHFEAEQKVSSQQQKLNELQALHQNVEP